MVIIAGDNRVTIGNYPGSIVTFTLLFYYSRRFCVFTFPFFVLLLDFLSLLNIEKRQSNHLIFLFRLNRFGM